MPRVLCIGHAVQDFVFAVETMPTSAEKYRADGFETLGGGPAATAAVAIAGLGGEAALAARVGADRIADMIVTPILLSSVTIPIQLPQNLVKSLPQKYLQCLT